MTPVLDARCRRPVRAPTPLHATAREQLCPK